MFSFVLVDPEGGLNSFVLSKPPPTYKVPATLEQIYSLPRGHYKYWVRHLNAGSQMKVNIDWPSDAMLHFCLVTTSIDAYLRDSDHCVVKLQSRSRITFEHVTKHSGDYFFILESIIYAETPSPTTFRHANSIPVEDIDPSPPSGVATIPFPKRGGRPVPKGPESKHTSSKPLLVMKESQTFESPRTPIAEPSSDDDLLVLKSKGDSKTSKQGKSSTDSLSKNQEKDGPTVFGSDRVSLLGMAQIEEQPEFFIVKANVSFDMTLIQYDTNQADDLFVGSFSKEFELNRPEYLVLYNPSDSHIYSVSISLARRYKELFIAVFIVEIVLISVISCCCYWRYNNVPLRRDDENGVLRLRRSSPNSLGGSSKKRNGRILGNDGSKAIGEREADSSIGHLPSNPWDLPVPSELEASRSRRMLNSSNP